MINSCLGFSSHYLVFIALKDWKQVIRMETAFQKETEDTSFHWNIKLEHTKRSKLHVTYMERQI